MENFENICKKIYSTLPEGSAWEIDDRFNTAAVSFENNISDKILSILSEEFENKLDKTTYSKASKPVKRIVKSLSGLEKEQFFFTTDEKNDNILFAAWWPWGSGENTSLRIGVKSSSMSDDDVKQMLCKLFKI